MDAKERGLPVMEVTKQSLMLDFVYHCNVLSSLEGREVSSDERSKAFEEDSVTFLVTTSLEEITPLNRDIRPAASLSIIYKKLNGRLNVNSYVFFRTPDVKLREYEVEDADDVEPFYPFGVYFERDVDTKELQDRVMLLRKLKERDEREKKQKEEEKTKPKRWQKFKDRLTRKKGKDDGFSFT